MRRRPLHPTGWSPPLALRGHAFACIPVADAVAADLFTSPLPAIPTVWQCRCGLTLVFCASLADVFEARPDLVEPRARLFDVIECTCYLGHPDDPTADEEACTACDARFWARPVAVFLEDSEATDG